MIIALRSRDRINASMHQLAVCSMYTYSVHGYAYTYGTYYDIDSYIYSSGSTSCMIMHAKMYMYRKGV